MENSKSKEMAKIAIEALKDKKGEDIRVIDISEVSVIADYFIIVTGNNPMQVQALADNAEEKLAKKKSEPFAGAYWCLVTAIYLGWSFWTMNWSTTWIVWPVAGVLFAAVVTIIKVVMKVEE